MAPTDLLAIPSSDTPGKGVRFDGILKRDLPNRLLLRPDDSDAANPTAGTRDLAEAISAGFALDNGDAKQLWAPRIQRVAKTVKAGTQWALVLIATDQASPSNPAGHEADTAPGALALADALRHIPERPTCPPLWKVFKEAEIVVVRVTAPLDVEHSLREIAAGITHLVPSTVAHTSPPEVNPILGTAIPTLSYATLAAAAWFGLVSSQPVRAKRFKNTAPVYASPGTTPSVAAWSDIEPGAGLQIEQHLLSEPVRKIVVESAANLNPQPILALHKLLARAGIGFDARDPAALAADLISTWLSRSNYASAVDRTASEVDTLAAETRSLRTSLHQDAEAAAIKALELTCTLGSATSHYGLRHRALLARWLLDDVNKDRPTGADRARTAQRNWYMHPAVLRDPRSTGPANTEHSVQSHKGSTTASTLFEHAIPGFAAGGSGRRNPIARTIVLCGGSFRPDHGSLTQADLQLLRGTFTEHPVVVLESNASDQREACEVLVAFARKCCTRDVKKIAIPDRDAFLTSERSRILDLGGPARLRTEVISDLVAMAADPELVIWSRTTGEGDTLQRVDLAGLYSTLTADAARQFGAGHSAALHRGLDVVDHVRSCAASEDVDRAIALASLDPNALGDDSAARLQNAATLLLDRAFAELGLGPSRISGDANEGLRMLELGLVALAECLWWDVADRVPSDNPRIDRLVETTAARVTGAAQQPWRAAWDAEHHKTLEMAARRWMSILAKHPACDTDNSPSARVQRIVPLWSIANDAARTVRHRAYFASRDRSVANVKTCLRGLLEKPQAYEAAQLFQLVGLEPVPNLESDLLQRLARSVMLRP